MTGKRLVTAVVALPSLTLVACSALPWASGRSGDPVLGQRIVTVTGGQAAPGAFALALVAMAALVVVLTGGRPLRRAASAVIVAVGVGAAVLVGSVLRDPSGAVGRRAAEDLARIGPVATEATSSAWVWVAFAAAVLLVLAGGYAAYAATSWAGLPSRFERPTAVDDPGARPDRSAWDAISDGHDPTREPPTGHA